MAHHCDDSGYGCGTSRRQVPAHMIVTSSSSMELDTGDADEFTFNKAGDFACFRGFSPYGQGKVAVAS